jgi:hypothetical protein
MSALSKAKQFGRDFAAHAIAPLLRRLAHAPNRERATEPTILENEKKPNEWRAAYATTITRRAVSRCP